MSAMLSDDKYQETKNIVLKKIKQTPLVAEFAYWFSQEYSTTLLNIEFAKVNPSDTKDRLLIIIENRIAVIQSNTLSTEHQNIIARKFIELSAKHHFVDIKKLEDIYVSFCIFPNESRSVLIAKTLNEAIVFLKNKYPDVLRIQTWQGTIAVIYHLDMQAIENEKRGINKAIMDDYFVILKKHDDLNYFTEPLSGIFVSQENLNEHYMGELIYYMW